MKTGRSLERAAIEYATALRMGEGVPTEVERELHAALASLRDDLGDAQLVRRDLAALLTELIVTSWASTASYPSRVRAPVELSVALIGEAIMSVLTPDEMPAAPASQ